MAYLSENGLQRFWNGIKTKVPMLDQNGNITLAGSITLGSNTTDEATLTPAILKQLINLAALQNAEEVSF